MGAFARICFFLFVSCLYVHGQSSSPSPLPQPPANSSAPPAAQPLAQQQQQQAPSTVLKVTTRLVVVDVVATDKHDQPVTDLKAEDFTLLENGKPQEIRIFNFHGLPPSGTASPAFKPAKLPPNVFTNIPTYSQKNSLNVVVLDLLNTDFDDQAYGRQQILKYLGGIPDGEPIAIALYVMGRKLQLIQDFTSDFATLRNAVNGVKDQRSLSQDNAAAGITLDTPTNLQIKGFAKAHEEVDQLDLRVKYTLEGLNALARKLSGYPGRKNLIWISTTFPIGLGPDENGGPNEFAQLREYEQAIVSTAQALQDAEIALYPVDPRGPLSLSIYGGHNNGPSSGGNSDVGIAEHATMDRMAGITGGKAYYNQNDIDDAIRGSIADGSTYYTLAYYPDNKNWNGEFRKIAVKLGRPGVRLRHRPGYYALQVNANPGPAQAFAAFWQALSLDSPISTTLRFEVGVVQPSDKTANKTLLNFALDPHAVTFETGNDGLHHAEVECAVQAFTEKGKVVNTDANILRLDLDDQGLSKALQSYLLARVAIALPPDLYLLRVGVMDKHSGVIGTTTARITINAPNTGAETKPAETKP